MEVLVFLVWFSIALFTGSRADARGRNGFAWFCIAALLGIFGTILLYCMSNEALKSCPDCGESILKGAKVCKHCGKRFDGPVAAVSAPVSLVAADRHCPKCNASVSATAQVCLECGEELA